MENVLAIGNAKTGKTKLNGWGGKFDLIQPENDLIIHNQAELEK